jgi:hypothetical protein
MIDRACQMFSIYILNSKFHFRLFKKYIAILTNQRLFNKSKAILLFLCNKLYFQFFVILKNYMKYNQKEVKFVYL